MKSSYFPKISIIVPNLNMATYLGITLDSILACRYKNLELIVIDGGSTDDSVDLIRSYESNISYWVSEPDLGLYSAVKKGFSFASGEVLAWLNSDDYYFPWTLNVVGHIFSEYPNVDWISSLMPGGMNASGICTGIGSIPGFSVEAFLEGYYLPNSEKILSYGTIQQESTFFRRSLWDKVKSDFMPDLKLAGDYGLWLQFISFSTLVGVTAPLACFRVRPGQLSHNIDQYIREAKSITTGNKKSSVSKAVAFHLLQKTRIRRIEVIAKLFGDIAGFEGEKIVFSGLTTEINSSIEKYKFI